MTKPLVSILVPICNAEHHLRECLDSLVNQSLENIEIICISDESDCDSFEIVCEYERKDERIVVMDKHNDGCNNSMNMAMELARGKFIGIVKSNDFVAYDMFERFCEIANNNDADIVRSNYFVRHTNQDTSIEFTVENLAPCQSAYGKVISPLASTRVFMCKPAIWSGIYRKQMLLDNNVRFSDAFEASLQDRSCGRNFEEQSQAAFNFKALYAAKRVVLTEDAFLHHRISAIQPPVKSCNEVFCVCDEYAEIWNYVQLDSQKFDKAKTLIPRLQFEDYLWSLNHLAPILQEQFYSRCVEEFKSIDQAGLIAEEQFGKRNFEHLRQMTANPNSYYELRYGPKSPERSIVFGLSNLDVEKAKAVAARIVLEFDKSDEIFIVHPESEKIVCQIKNELEDSGCVRNDLDLISIPISGSIDHLVLRGSTVVLAAVKNSDFSFTEARDSLKDSDFACDDKFAIALLEASALTGIEEEHLSLPYLFSLKCLETKENISNIGDDWASAFCYSESLRNDFSNVFFDAVAAAKATANLIFGSSASYEVKRALLLGFSVVWKSVRSSYYKLRWSVAPKMRSVYENMADVLGLPYKTCADMPSAAPKISVVVPVYNSEKYIDECFASILGQDFEDFEIIAINDGSTDKTLDILENYADSDERITVVSELNCGAGAARNRGIALARGEKIIFIDPDDLYPSTRVFSSLFDAMNKSGALICGGSLELLEPSGEVTQHYRFCQSFYEITKEEMVAPNHFWNDYGWIRFMYDSSLFKDGKLVFPQLAWYEDPVFLLRAIVLAQGCYVIPEPVYRYRVDYKETEWTLAKARDLLVGITCNLEIAKSNNMGELYAVLIDRVTHQYGEAIKLNRHDDGVFAMLAQIAANADLDLLHKYSNFDGDAIRVSSLEPANTEEREVAIQRVARVIGESRAYLAMQNLILRVKHDS